MRPEGVDAVAIGTLRIGAPVRAGRDAAEWP
jgi:hypothetical protein